MKKLHTFSEHTVRDADSGVSYTPFITSDGRIGYTAERTGRGKLEQEYIYLNPSTGSDDGVPTVFVYTGTENDPALDKAHHFYTVLDEEAASNDDDPRQRAAARLDR